MNLLSKTIPSTKPDSVVFLIHGTRNAEAQAYIHEAMTSLCPQFSETLGLAPSDVTYAFLEIMEPALDGVLKQLCASGKTDLRIIPLLLFPGSHLNHDIPRIAQEVMDQYPEAVIQIGQCVGVHEPEFTSILLKRL